MGPKAGSGYVSVMTTKDDEVLKELKALTEELKTLKKEVKDICADLVSFADELATDFADAELKLLCDNLRDISVGTLRTLVRVRMRTFKAQKEHNLSQERTDEH